MSVWRRHVCKSLNISRQKIYMKISKETGNQLKYDIFGYICRQFVCILLSRLQRRTGHDEQTNTNGPKRLNKACTLTCMLFWRCSDIVLILDPKFSVLIQPL